MMELGKKLGGNMDKNEIDALGSVVDSAVNYHALTALPIAIAQRGVKLGLADIAWRLRDLYVKVAGTDPWDGDPTFPPRSE